MRYYTVLKYLIDISLIYQKNDTTEMRIVKRIIKNIFKIH